MGQLLLPLFPVETEMLTSTLGVFVKGGTVFYLHCEVPRYSHSKGDHVKFRYFSSHLIVQGLCGYCDIERVFHVTESSVLRWKIAYLEEGEAAFFKPENRHARRYKLVGDLLERIQNGINKGYSYNSIARQEGISEGSIRYAIQ